MQEPRETLGAVLRSKKFIVHSTCFVVCVTILLICTIQGLWMDFYVLNRYTLRGLLAGNFLGLFASFCIITSWLLVDDISWFGKAIHLFVAGITMTICGAYYTIKFLDYGMDVYQKKHSERIRNLHYSHWLPVMGAVNFILGIFTLLLCFYVSLKWDS